VVSGGFEGRVYCLKLDRGELAEAALPPPAVVGPLDSEAGETIAPLQATILGWTSWLVPITVVACLSLQSSSARHQVALWVIRPGLSRPCLRLRLAVAQLIHLAHAQVLASVPATGRAAAFAGPVPTLSPGWRMALGCPTSASTIDATFSPCRMLRYLSCPSGVQCCS